MKKKDKTKDKNKDIKKKDKKIKEVNELKFVRFEPEKNVNQLVYGPPAMLERNRVEKLNDE